VRNAIGRAAATAMLAALLGAAWVALFYAWHPALAVEFDRDLPRNFSGVYPPERDDTTGLTFAWTGQDMVLRLPGLDRRIEWTLDVRLRGGRATPDANPDVTILADSVPLATRHASQEFEDVRVTVPAQPDRRGVVLGLRASSTFVPGAADPRPLGVMLDRWVLSPSAVVLVPRPALIDASLSSAAMGAAIALLGVTAGSAIGGAVLLSAAVAAVMARGFGPFTGYPDVLLSVSLWIALATAGSVLIVQYRRRQPLRQTARFAVAFTASALFLKLLVLLHPNMPIGDAMFHAHRFQGVLRGNLYFTSIAPGGYAFPYPPGLYVFAALFAGAVRRGASDMALLRVITCSVDAAASLLLYAVVMRAGNNRLSAAISVAFYHLIPENFSVLATGNFTNAFAQSVAVGALAIMGSSSLSARRWTMTSLLAIVLAIAFLSHTGTLAIGFTASMITAALFWLRGGGQLRPSAIAIGIAALIAALVATGLYYAHFMDTYRAEFARIGHETAAAATDAGGRTIGDRLRFVPYAFGVYIGAPVLLVALIGGTQMWRWPRGDRLALAVAGWLSSCLLFLVVGIVTPVDMRHYLAAVPALAIAAGYGAAWTWNPDGPVPVPRPLFRLAAILLLAAPIFTAFHYWWNALGSQ
jgi:hypothetical protein